MFEYKLLNNKIGVLINGTPETVKDNLKIKFIESPSNSVASVVNERGESFYRNLNSGICEFPASALKGILRVSVTVANGSVNPPKWACDELIGCTVDGVVLVCPNTAALIDQVAQLRLENDQQNKDIKNLIKRLNSLETKVNYFIEGSDI